MVPASVCFGNRDHANPGDRGSPLKFANSIRRMEPRIQAGVHLASTANCFSSASASPKPTVSRYLRRFRRGYEAGKAKRWLAFLKNHREVIVAFDFFYGSHAELF